MSRFALGPKIGVHTKVAPVASLVPVPIDPTAPVVPIDQVADFQGIAPSATSDDAVFALRPLGATDVPLVAIHVVVAPIPDGGVSPIPVDATVAQLLDPASPFGSVLRGVYSVPLAGDPPTPVRVPVADVPFGATDWRTVFEYAS